MILDKNSKKAQFWTLIKNESIYETQIALIHCMYGFGDWHWYTEKNLSQANRLQEPIEEIIGKKDRTLSKNHEIELVIAQNAKKQIYM